MATKHRVPKETPHTSVGERALSTKNKIKSYRILFRINLSIISLCVQTGNRIKNYRKDATRFFKSRAKNIFNLATFRSSFKVVGEILNT